MEVAVLLHDLEAFPFTQTVSFIYSLLCSFSCGSSSYSLFTTSCFNKHTSSARELLEPWPTNMWRVHVPSAVAKISGGHSATRWRACTPNRAPLLGQEGVRGWLQGVLATKKEAGRGRREGEEEEENNRGRGVREERRGSERAPGGKRGRS